MSSSAYSAPKFNAVATAVSSVVGSSLLSAAAQAQQPQESILEEVTVTGSRIVRRDFSAPSPIVTVDTARLEQSSTLSIESVLNQMPQFTPAGTQFLSGGQGSPLTSLGIASLNLRGIGTNRTLVLVDGRRPQPANAGLVVDINTIPAAAVERVETITGGASAVYGPDALAGVVNFVLRNNFEGIDFDFSNSITAEGDGQERRFTTLFGMNAADGRGNMMLGLEYYDRETVWQRDRDFYRNGWYEAGTNAGGFILAPGFSFAGPDNRPDQDLVNQIWAQYHPTVAPPVVGWGPAGPLPGAVHEIYFNTDGTPFVIPGARGFNGPFATTALGTGVWGMRINPNGNLGQVWNGNMASTPQERHSIFGRARYDVSDNITAFAQLTYSNNTVKTTQATISPAITVWQAHIPSDGRALPPALQALLDARPDPTQDWRLFRGIDLWQEAASVDNSNNVYQLTAGLEGRFPNNDWTWEFYVSRGQTDTRNDYRNLPSLQRWRWLNALPEFGAGDATGLPGQPGNPIGQAGVPPVGAGSGPGRHVFGREYVLECASGLPIFGGFANITPDCLDSLDSRARASSTLTQDVFEFNVQGALADMRAGELRFAAGAAYRDNTFRFEPLNDNRVVSDHPVGLFVSDNTYGEMDVKEVYGELLVPVAERLSLEFGYRYSEFNTAAGNVDTWKALFDYAATDSIRLRGGFQAATRAPNTAEMFQGPIMLTVGFGPSDPCSFSTTAPWGNRADNPNRAQVQQLCIDLIGNPNTPMGGAPGPAADQFARPGVPFFPLENVFEQGNPDLSAESADTWTFGVVFGGVGGIDNLTASIDMYNIDISDAIARINPVFVYEQCFNVGGSNPTWDVSNEYCQLIGRHPLTGERDTVRTPFRNTGALKTAGVDLALNWATDLRNGGSFYINSLVSYLDKYQIQEAPNAAFLEAKGTLAEGGQFDYRLNNTFGYDFSGGRASVGLRWIHLPEVEDAATIRPGARQLPADSYNLFSLFASYNVSDRIVLRGGIDNLFDEDPRVVGRDPGTNPSAGCPGSPQCNNNSANTLPQFYDILGRRAYLGVKMSF
jgi:iron complex outermembrane recepter protein